MLCLACARPGFPLCGPCVASLRRAPPSRIGDIRIEAGFRHVGAAVRLVHNLKYRRSMSAGRLLAGAMVSGLASDARALVPIPRSFVRRVSFGIDQAVFLASELGALTGLPVVRALDAPLWWKRQAGAAREDRHSISFHRIGSVPEGAVLVDDVLTTGITSLSAIAALGVGGISVVVATSAGTMESGTELFPSLEGDVAQQRRTIGNRSHGARPRLQTESPETTTVDSPRPFRSTDREEIG